MANDHLFVHGVNGGFICTSPHHSFFSQFVALSSPFSQTVKVENIKSAPADGSHTATASYLEAQAGATSLAKVVSCHLTFWHIPGKRLKLEFDYGCTPLPDLPGLNEYYFLSFGSLVVTNRDASPRAPKYFDFSASNPDAWYRFRIYVYLAVEAYHSGPALPYHVPASPWGSLAITLEDIPT